MKIFEHYIPLDRQIQVMDVGAADIAEVPAYFDLVKTGKAHLHAFEGDERQIEALENIYGPNATIYNDFLYDGTVQNLYLASPESGMSSLLKPNEIALSYFNGFTHFGKHEKFEGIQTKKLDSIPNLPPLDFIKMDIQGAELTVLKNGLTKMNNLIGVQLEVSYMPLYENQPTFGEVDVWMRSKGFSPHTFTAIKKWSISPTIFGGNFRVPGNQLLESDIIYIRNPLALSELDSSQLKIYAWLAHYYFQSVDLCVHVTRELMNRGELDWDFQRQYYEAIS
jgi:FkbM family methyltransferase